MLSHLARFAALLLMLALLLDILGWLPNTPLLGWIFFPLAIFLLVYPLLRR